MNVDLYSIKEDAIKNVKVDDAIFKIYYQEYRIPTSNELRKGNSKMTVKEIKKIISSDEQHVPLYDVFTENLYIIIGRNVYSRVVNHDYRFPDELIMNSVIRSRDEKINKIERNPELRNDKVFMRSIRKANLMIDFMNQFDYDTLYSTYLKIFYKYAPDIGNLTYTCIRKSFIQHMSHLKPYYSKDEVIKLGMNMGIIKIPKEDNYIDYKENLSDEDYKDLCRKIQKNDISADILIQHQNYIINNNATGLVQYYTVQGSYFMNQYMRGMTKYSYRNDYLEENIKKMWKLVSDAPEFDNDYILYRFVNDDTYLKHLKIGDIYIEKGFTSTTRDPFYRNDLYKFGFVLIKIRVPKNIKGIGLCLETLSHFPAEEEIILPPMSHIRLLSKNEKCKYYHPDEEFVSNIKIRYEFEWIKNGKIAFPKRKEYKGETKLIDFLKLDKTKTMTVKEKIDIMINKYFDPMSRIKCKIGDKTFYVIAEWYDSTGPYEPMYSLKTTNGFILYSMYEGYILFMIEIGEHNGHDNIRVNYFTKYSQLVRSEIMGDDNFINFISSVTYYFEIPNIIIYADFLSCDKMINIMDSKKLSRAKKKYNKIIKSGFKKLHHTLPIYKIEEINTAIRKQRMFSSGITDTNDKKHIIELYDDKQNKLTDMTDSYVGGTYCVDFYLYLKHNIKRYQNTDTLDVELQPQFSYHDLDYLKSMKPSSILRKEDRDEIYQIYMKTYKPNIDDDDDNLASMYIWMIENKCYLMDIFENKLNRIYRDNNPFKKTAYLLDGLSYLYNRRLISTYNRYIKMNYNEEHQLLTLPKNEYRIKRV